MRSSGAWVGGEVLVGHRAGQTPLARACSALRSTAKLTAGLSLTLFPEERPARVEDEHAQVCRGRDEEARPVDPVALRELGGALHQADCAQPKSNSAARDRGRRSRCVRSEINDKTADMMRSMTPGSTGSAPAPLVRLRRVLRRRSRAPGSRGVPSRPPGLWATLAGTAHRCSTRRKSPWVSQPQISALPWRRCRRASCLPASTFCAPTMSKSDS